MSNRSTLWRAVFCSTKMLRGINAIYIQNSHIHYYYNSKIDVKGQIKKSLIDKALFICRRWDSNPQGANHMNLNHARLPIPPLRHKIDFI